MGNSIEEGNRYPDTLFPQSDRDDPDSADIRSRVLDLFHQSISPEALLEATLYHDYYPMSRSLLLSLHGYLPTIELVHFLEQYLSELKTADPQILEAVINAFSEPERYDITESSTNLPGNNLSITDGWSSSPQGNLIQPEHTDRMVGTIAEICLHRTYAAYRIWLHTAIRSDIPGFGREVGNAAFQLACMNSYLHYRQTMKTDLR